MALEMQRTFRVDRRTWERFKKLCRKEDMAASQMIRRMIRERIRKSPGPRVAREPARKS